MTLAVSTRRQDYTGNGSTATYSYGFKIYDDDDILILVSDVDEVESTLIKVTDYNVTGVGTSSGGSIVLVDNSQAWIDSNGFLATGYHLTILGNRSKVQDTSIRNQKSYYPNVIEDQFDKEAVLAQELAERVNRAVTFQKTSTESGIELTFSLDGNAGKVLVVNDAEDSFALGISLDTLEADLAAAAADASDASASAAAAAGSASAASASASSASVSAVAAAASAVSAAASAASASAAVSAGVLQVENTHASPYALLGAGTIPFTAGNQRVKKYIQGSGGAQTAGDIQAGTIDGQELYLFGCSNINTATIDSSTNVICKGTMVLGDNDVGIFNWDNGQSKWLEVARNN